MKGILIVVVVVGSAIAVAFLLVGSLKEPAPSADLPGLVKALPDDYLMERVDGIDDAEAIRRLLDLAGDHPEAPRLGVRYLTGEKETHLLLDREEDVVLRWSSSAATLVETRWEGSHAQRLDHARRTGSFAADGLLPARSRNLYH